MAEKRFGLGNGFRLFGVILAGLAAIAVGFQITGGRAGIAFSWWVYVWLTAVAVSAVLAGARFPVIDERRGAGWRLIAFAAFIAIGSVASNLPALTHFLPFYFASARGLTLLILGGILAPITEEVLFHGIIQTDLNKRARPGIVRTGTLIAAGMFALSHAVGYAVTHNLVATAISVLSALAFGLINGVWYERTNDLRGCILVHVIGNILTNVT